VQIGNVLISVPDGAALLTWHFVHVPPGSFLDDGLAGN
jgi:hypothetical protein